jgi:hypothetical protein
MKIFAYVIISILFILITFFGLGPVMFADGSMSERILTLAVVIVLYLLLGWITIRLTKHQKHVKK